VTNTVTANASNGYVSYATTAFDSVTVTHCGNGACDCSETCSSCATDCGSCPSNDECSRDSDCSGSDVCCSGDCKECCSASDCNDGIDCTIDSCVDGACVYDASACACEEDEDCPNLECKFASCIDNACAYANLEGPCDDGNACTINDICSGGICSGIPLTCDDNNSCTDNSCDPELGCVFTPNNDSCGDDPCYDSFCMNAACTLGPFICDCETDSDCDDGNPCTSQSCANGTCIYSNRDGPCDANDECTENDYCSNGRCVPGDNICGEKSCKEIWECELGECINGSQTIFCVCSCGGEPCGENISQRDCEMPMQTLGILNLSAQSELEVGDTLEISVFDESGNLIEATITLIRPDGSLVLLENGFYTVDHAGEWRILAEKDGFRPAEGETLVREKPLAESPLEQIAQSLNDFVEFMAEPMRFTLLLVFVAGLSFFLLFPRFKKKDKVEKL
jgi:hypothetical protein